MGPKREREVRWGRRRLSWPSPPPSWGGPCPWPAWERKVSSCWAGWKWSAQWLELRQQQGVDLMPSTSKEEWPIKGGLTSWADCKGKLYWGDANSRLIDSIKCLNKSTLSHNSSHVFVYDKSIALICSFIKCFTTEKKNRMISDCNYSLFIVPCCQIPNNSSATSF